MVFIHRAEDLVATTRWPTEDDLPMKLVVNADVVADASTTSTMEDSRNMVDRYSFPDKGRETGEYEKIEDDDNDIDPVGIAALVVGLCALIVGVANMIYMSRSTTSDSGGNNDGGDSVDQKTLGSKNIA